MERLTVEEQSEVALIEESAPSFSPPSYSDKRLAQFFRKISERKKEEGMKSRNFGIALFVAASIFLAVSLVFD